MVLLLFLLKSAANVIAIWLKIRKLRIILVFRSFVSCSAFWFWKVRAHKILSRCCWVSCSSDSWLSEYVIILWSNIKFWLFVFLLLDGCEISSSKKRRPYAIHWNKILICLSRTNVLLLRKITHGHIVCICWHKNIHLSFRSDSWHTSPAFIWIL